MAEKRKVHLVLGSGGARGMAHIGVIEELEKQGYEIIEVIGCSMGAVVGGIYSAGALPKYHRWLLDLSKSGVWRLLDFTFAKHGFVKGERVFEAILDLMGPRNIEDLPIPFTAVATDLSRSSEVIFDKGDLYQALRASISIPGIFTPIQNEKSLLVDGGVLNPLPLNLVDKREDAIIVAVNVNARSEAPEEPEMVKDERAPKEIDEPSGFNTWLNLLWPSSKEEAETPVEYSVFELLQTSYNHTQDQLAKMTIMHYRPDILVNIPRSTCAIFEFYRAAEVIDRGRAACHKALLTPENKSDQ